MHDPAIQDAQIDRGAYRTRPSNRVDCPQVVLVTVAEWGPMLQPDAQARAKQLGLDVMGRERVARMETVHPAIVNQPLQKWARARVHDGGPADEEDVAPRVARRPHAFRHASDECALRPLGGDAARHETEALVRLLRFPAGGAEPVMADDEHVPSAHIREAHTLRHESRFALTYTDGTVHLDALHLQPLPAHTHMGGQIGRGVEAFGIHTVHVDGR